MNPSIVKRCLVGTVLAIAATLPGFQQLHTSVEGLKLIADYEGCRLQPYQCSAGEGLSVAGPTAAYEFHARSADGRVADASATSPAPAEVVLTVLSREGDGTAEKDLLDVVEKALNSENVRPVADRLTVRSAEIIPYRVEATIFLYPGPEAEPVMAAAKASLQKYIASQTRLGRDIRRSAIFAAMHVEGVQRVELASPLADVVLNKTQAASCTQWSVTNGGTDE